MYTPSTLEKKVSDLFKKADILHPSDLKPEIVAHALNIEYDWHFGPACSGFLDSQPFIIVDARKTKIEQQEQFFHELCHVLRHYGNQNRQMPEPFRELQEWDASLFTLYSVMPFHMIDFSKSNTKESLMSQFDVSNHLAKKRFTKIKQKLNYRFFKEEKIPRKKKNYSLSPFNFKKCSDETKRLITQLERQTGGTLL